MDIYTILSSKSHNPHYLNRYIKFIENCQQKNVEHEGYSENHHICPRSMFPDHKSTDGSKNKIIFDHEEIPLGWRKGMTKRKGWKKKG